MASPNALNSFGDPLQTLDRSRKLLKTRSVVVFTLESDLRSPSRARRTYPRLVRPEQEQKPVINPSQGLNSALLGTVRMQIAKRLSSPSNYLNRDLGLCNLTSKLVHGFQVRRARFGVLGPAICREHFCAQSSDLK